MAVLNQTTGHEPCAQPVLDIDVDSISLKLQYLPFCYASIINIRNRRESGDLRGEKGVYSYVEFGDFPQVDCGKGSASVA